VVAQNQRLRIIDAAISVFAQQGYPATTVDDIVAAAEIGVGSFYSFYGGKEECLLDAYERIVSMAKGELERAVAGASVWEERICQGLRRTLDLVVEEPQRARIALVEIQTAGAPALERYNETLLELSRQLAAGRERADEARWVPGSLEAILSSCFAWMLHRRASFGGDATPRLLNEMAELALEPYLGEAGAHNVIAKGPRA